MAVNLDNERKYLEGLLKSGTSGQKEWAKKQAKEYGFNDFGQPKPTAPKPTTTTRLSQDDYTQQLREKQKSAKSYEDFMKIEQDFGTKQGGWYDSLGQFVDEKKYKNDDVWRKQYFKDNEEKRYKNALDAKARGELVVLNGDVYNGGKLIQKGKQTGNQTNNTTTSFGNNSSPFSSGGRSNPSIDKIYDLQKQSQLAQLNAAREKAVGGLNQQKAELKPQYQGLRNQTDAVNLQNVQRLREAMANMGLTSSGENVTQQTALAGQRQGALNNLNLQEQQNVNDIDRRIADLNNPNDELAITSALEAERAKALLQDMYYNTDRGDRLSQQAIENAMREAGMTGMYNGAPTMDYSNLMFNQNMAQDQFDWGRLMDQQGINQWQQQFDYGKTRDSIGDKQWEREFALRSRPSSGGGYTKPLTSTQMRANYVTTALQQDNPLQWVQDHYADLAMNGINASDVLSEVQQALKIAPKNSYTPNKNMTPDNPLFFNPFFNPNL